MPHVYTIDGAQVALPTVDQSPVPVGQSADIVSEVRTMWIVGAVLGVAALAVIPISIYLWRRG